MNDGSWMGARRGFSRTRWRSWLRPSSMEEVLREADLISLHPVIDKTMYHLITLERLAMMETVLVNTSQGPVIDEGQPHVPRGAGRVRGRALHEAGLGGEQEGVVVPHITSASKAFPKMSTMAAKQRNGDRQGGQCFCRLQHRQFCCMCQDQSLAFSRALLHFRV